MSSREWNLSYFSSRSASPVSPSASKSRPGHLCSSITSDWWPSTELCEEILLLGGESWNNYIFWQGDRHFESRNSYILWLDDGHIPHWSHPTQQSMSRPWSVDISKMWIHIWLSVNVVNISPFLKSSTVSLSSLFSLHRSTEGLPLWISSTTLPSSSLDV